MLDYEGIRGHCGYRKKKSKVHQPKQTRKTATKKRAKIVEVMVVNTFKSPSPRIILLHNLRASQISQSGRRHRSTTSPWRGRRSHTTQVKLEKVASERFDSIASKILQLVNSTFKSFEVVARVHFWGEF
jgi:hypothetical protein